MSHSQLALLCLSFATVGPPVCGVARSEFASCQSSSFTSMLDCLVGIEYMADATSDPLARDWKQMDIPSLDPLFGSQKGIDEILGLQGPNAIVVVDLLDRALDLPDINDHRRGRYTRAIRKLCGTCGILPTSHTLPGGVEIVGPRPHSSGGFADVWIAEYDGRLVAIKSLKISESDDLHNIKKQFAKEVLLWKRLSHANVLPFRGVADIPRFQFCMVSDWMSHGNIMHYIKSHSEANRIVLLCDIATGLGYLHENHLVHGDLKGLNILINDDHHAVIADFGLGVVLSTDSGTLMSSAESAGGTVRWMAPELLFPEKHGFPRCIPSMESDTYAFGMVIYEVMTGDMPFPNYNKHVVILKTMKGSRPNRPKDAAAINFSDPLWHITEQCWKQRCTERTKIHAVIDGLSQITQHWVAPPPVTNSLDPDSGDDSDGSSWTFTSDEVDVVVSSIDDPISRKKLIMRPFFDEVKIAGKFIGGDNGEAPATAEDLISTLPHYFMHGSKISKIESTVPTSSEVPSRWAIFRNKKEQATATAWSVSTPKWSRATLIDMAGRCNFVQLLSEGQSPGDGAIVVLSGRLYGSSDQLIATTTANEARIREQLFLAYAAGLMNLVVVITHMDTIPSNGKHRKRRFKDIMEKTAELTEEIGYAPGSVIYVPMGASFGENITGYQIPKWYKGWHKETKDSSVTGRTLEEAIESIAISVHRLDHPLHLMVIYTYANQNTIKCRVLSGILRNQMSLTFCPGDVGHTMGLMRMDGKVVEEAQPGEVVDIDVSQDTYDTLQVIESTPEMGYETTTPMRRIASCIARIVINGDRIGTSAGDLIWLRIYGKCYHCDLDQTLEIKDRSGRILDTRQSDLKDGEICRVRFSNFRTGHLPLKPYGERPELSRIALFDDLTVRINIENVVATGVVESIEYL